MDLPQVLVFDIGTQSTRAMLINSCGEVCGKVQENHHPVYDSLYPEWAEKDPLFYYRNMITCAQKLAKEKADLWPKIKAITVTAIRDTVVCVDKNGQPLRPAILWMDKRKFTDLPKLNPASRLIFKTLGIEQTVNTHFQRSACNWIMINQPEIWAKTDKFLLLSGFLNYQLTGKMNDAVASTVGHVPFDVKTRSWQSKWALTRPVFDVPAEKLCDLVETCGKLGGLRSEVAELLNLPSGTPVLASGSDKACETIGLGCVDSTSAAISFGTTASITTISDKYIEPARFIPPFPALRPGYYSPEIEIFRGYWLVSWFKREFAEKEMLQAVKLGCTAEELLNRRLQEIPPGCDGLILQPYFAPNVNMPVAKGAIIGFSSVHTRIHIYRAIIEGINFALIDGMHTLEKRGNLKFERLLLGGGGSQSAEICQITANMFGLPAVRTQTFEVSGIGAAMAAMIGLGVYKDFPAAGRAMAKIKDIFEPDPEQTAIYARLMHEIYDEIYPRLAPLYQRLTEMNLTTKKD